jgi:RNase P subunit RPR2
VHKANELGSRDFVPFLWPIHGLFVELLWPWLLVSVMEAWLYTNTEIGWQSMIDNFGNKSRIFQRTTMHRRVHKPRTRSINMMRRLNDQHDRYHRNSVTRPPPWSSLPVMINSTRCLKCNAFNGRVSDQIMTFKEGERTVSVCPDCGTVARHHAT